MINDTSQHSVQHKCDLDAVGRLLLRCLTTTLQINC